MVLAAKAHVMSVLVPQDLDSPYCYSDSVLLLPFHCLQWVNYSFRAINIVQRPIDWKVSIQVHSSPPNMRTWRDKGSTVTRISKIRSFASWGYVYYNRYWFTTAIIIIITMIMTTLSQVECIGIDIDNWKEINTCRYTLVVNVVVG